MALLRWGGLITFAMAFLPLPVLAGMNGVWQGTIGNLAVLACFQDQGGHDGIGGAYYYLDHLRLITLSPKNTKNSKGWIEMGSGGERASNPWWEVHLEGQDHITGTWHGARRMLRINLKRIAPGGSACSSTAFTSLRDKAQP